MSNLTKPGGSSADKFLEDYFHKVPAEVLLAELDAALVTKPTLAELKEGSDVALGWLGRVKATLHAWDNVRSSKLVTIETELYGFAGLDRPGYFGLIALINEARAALVLKTGRPSTVAAQGAVHDYFDGLRQIIERATTDLYFADPYLDADFVGRYLPYVKPGVVVRMLAGKRLATLLPAVDAFATQHKMTILVRSLGEHDRYLFVDGKECFQSGATFHQGAVRASTAIVPIIDACAAITALYEDHWKKAKVAR